jgi:hypothetical protein
LQQKGILSPKALYNIVENQLQVQLINTTDQEVTLKEDQTLGVASPLVQVVQYKTVDFNEEDLRKHIAAQKSELSSNEFEQLQSLLLEYKDVFTNKTAGNSYITPSYEFKVDTGEHLLIHS